jgi:hypothetical protein
MKRQETQSRKMYKCKLHESTRARKNEYLKKAILCGYTSAKTDFHKNETPSSSLGVMDHSRY